MPGRGVIEAQVIARLRTQARVLGEPGPKLIFLEPARVAFSAATRRTLALYRRMWPRGEIAVVPFVSRLGASSAGASLAAYLAHERLRSAPLVFHCRGARATRSAGVARRLLGRGRIVYDLRGADYYETAHRLRNRWPGGAGERIARAAERVLAAERHAVAVADCVLAVSGMLRTYAIDMLGAAADRVSVTPSCVERLTFDSAARERARARWGVSAGSPVFVMSGQLTSDRLPQHVVRVFARVLAHRPQATMVLLTYGIAVAVDPLLAEYGVDRARVVRLTCSRDEVYEQLCGADVGMVFLEPALRFRYCFPIKFPEYLAAGLPVVVNRAAGDLADLVCGRRLGWVIDETLDNGSLDAAVLHMLAELDADREGARQRSLDCCSDLYLFHNHVAALREAYGFARPGHGEAAEPVVEGA